MYPSAHGQICTYALAFEKMKLVQNMAAANEQTQCLWGSAWSDAPGCLKQVLDDSTYEKAYIVHQQPRKKSVSFQSGAAAADVPPTRAADGSSAPADALPDAARSQVRLIV